MNKKILLTKRFEFCSSHSYYNKNLSVKENKKLFGKLSPYGHGHNYILEVTISGPVNKNTGMIINTYDLKNIVGKVLKEFDHKFLNKDTPYFKEIQPSTENIAQILWKKINAQLPLHCKLYKIKLYETSDLFVEYFNDNADEILDYTNFKRKI